MLINLKEALAILNENGVPIKYHTFYTWAVNSVTIGGRPLNLATQIGNRWMVSEDAVNEIVDGVKNHERIRIQEKKVAPVEEPEPPVEKPKPIAAKRAKSTKKPAK